MPFLRPTLGPAAPLAVLMAALSGCASSSAVPGSLQTQIDKSLTFVQIKESPDAYRGHTVVLGGEVLAAKRLKDGTRVEILQIPLEGQEPGWDRTKSQGRFVAFQKEFLDPATLPYGTRVTIVGEVTGVVTLPLDETEYAYPTLEIKNLKVWPDLSAQGQSAPYPAPYYWGPYWGRGYWYGPYWW
jgi:outer membrane lipoprotein